MIVFGPCPIGHRSFHVQFQVPQNAWGTAIGATANQITTGAASAGTWFLRYVITFGQWDAAAWGAFPTDGGPFQQPPFLSDLFTVQELNLFGALVGFGTGGWTMNNQGLGNGLSLDLQFGTCWDPLLGPCQDTDPTDLNFQLGYLTQAIVPFFPYTLDIYGQQFPFSPAP